MHDGEPRNKNRLKDTSQQTKGLTDLIFLLHWHENFFIKSDTVKLVLRKLGDILFDTAQENQECQDCIHLKV